MPELGNKVAIIMKGVLAPRRYKGTLEGSVKSEYHASLKEVVIGPDAKRGQYDAGMIAETGTVSIGNVPWRPILAWGLARGLTPKQAAGAWKKIQQSGVTKHPFLEETVRHPEFSISLEAAATKLATKLAAVAIAGGTGVAGATTA